MESNENINLISKLCDNIHELHEKLLNKSEESAGKFHELQEKLLKSELARKGSEYETVKLLFFLILNIVRTF